MAGCDVYDFAALVESFSQGTLLIFTYCRYIVDEKDGLSTPEQKYCSEELSQLQDRFDAQAVQLQAERERRLPGN